MLRLGLAWLFVLVLPAAAAPPAWPGRWATATAYTFNWRPYGPPPMNLWVYRPPGGLHEGIRNQHALTQAQGAAAAALVARTHGSVDISKCPFPRHGVVFWDADGKAIGSVSVCFECGDVLVWPEPAGRARGKANRDGVYTSAFLRRYEKALGDWTAFFRALPDMPPEWTTRKTPGDSVPPPP